MGHLRFAFLGTPLVQYNGRRIKFSTRKALALLIYLAVEGSSVPREKLIDLLWPDSDILRGRTALRTALTHLRNALQEKPNASHVLVEQDTLRFNIQSDFEFDLNTLEAAYLRACSGPAASLRHLRGQLQAAIALYRGDFLEGFSLNAAPEFDNWASLQREKWHQQLNAIFDRLTQLQFEGGETTSGLETATRWLAHDPLNEAAYRRLMLLQMAAGNRSGALQVYENCRRILKTELNADPSSETLALAKRIQTQTLDLWQVEPEPQRLFATEAPLVGRLNEHTTLATAYRAARRGESHVVTVVGEPGIGKTLLVKEFVRWAAAQGADVLQGQAFEMGGPLPYHPIVQALRARMARKPNVISRLDDVWLNELTRLLPELRTRLGRGNSPSTIDAGDARLRLFEAVAQLIQALAQRAPLVLVVDDLHWADAASRDLVHYLSRRCAETRAPVLFILTLRSEELSGALQEWLLTIERSWPSRRIALGPLAWEDTQQIAAAFLARQDSLSIPDPDSFAQKLYAETAGQPLFIVETLRAWLDEDTREFPALPLASGVRALIQARMNRLSDLARTILMAAAVLAQHFSLENVPQVASTDERQASKGLDELLSRGLLREARGQLYFTHDKIREVVYAEIGKTQRRLFHRRAGETLERQWSNGVEEQAAILAYHFDAAADARALKYFVLAGDVAARLYANVEAVQYYTRALEIAKRQGISPSPDLYLHRGRALELDARFDAALANYEDMASEARTQGNRAMELTALIAHNTVYAMPITMRDTAQAKAASEKARSLAHELSDRAAEAKILWNLMLHARHSTLYREAIAYGEQSLAIARELNLREQMAYTLHDLSNAYMFSGQVEQAQVARLEAADLWREFNNLPLLAESLSYASIHHCLAGEFLQSIAASQEAYQIGKKTGNQWAQSFSLIAVGMAHRERGEIDRAIETMTECVELSEQVGLVPPQAQTRAELARLYGDVGDIAQGIELARLALTRAEVLFPTYRLYALGVLAQLLLRAGQTAEAEAMVQAGLPDLNSENLFPLSRVMLALAATDLALASHDHERAFSMSEELVGLLRQLRIRIFNPSTLHFMGKALYNLGQHERALEVFNEAREEAEAIGARWSLWPILNTLSEIEARQGHEGNAQTLRRQARDAITQITEHLDNAKLRASLFNLPQVQALLGVGL